MQDALVQQNDQSFRFFERCRHLLQGSGHQNIPHSEAVFWRRLVCKVILGFVCKTVFVQTTENMGHSEKQNNLMDNILNPKHNI